MDYGSTTIILQLVDLNSGAVLCEEKRVNGQTEFGTDILTRITYAMEDPSHIEDLHQATIDTFRNLLDAVTEATGIRAEKCPVMILSGNTTMIHFLLKLDAWTVFASPYAPVTSDPGFFWGSELGIPFKGQVYIIPAASNYVGGDIVSGLLTMDMHKQEKTSLFFDIGTNGELVLGNQEWLLAGAGAAGHFINELNECMEKNRQKMAMEAFRKEMGLDEDTTIRVDAEGNFYAEQIVTGADTQDEDTQDEDSQDEDSQQDLLNQQEGISESTDDVNVPEPPVSTQEPVLDNKQDSDGMTNDEAAMENGE